MQYFFKKNIYGHESLTEVLNEPLFWKEKDDSLGLEQTKTLLYACLYCLFIIT